MVRIERLELTNFKSFGEVTIDFHDVNVIVGANASGKSNLLSAFQFLEDIYKYDLTEAINEQGGKDYIKNFKAEDNFVIITLHFRDGSQKKIANTNFSRRYEKLTYTITIWVEEDFWVLGNEQFILQTEIWYANNKILELPDFELNKEGGDINIYFPIENLLKNSSVKIPSQLLDNKDLLSPFSTNILDNDRRPHTENTTLLHLYGDYLAPSFFDFPVYEFSPYLKNYSSTSSPSSNLQEDGSNISTVIEQIIKDGQQKNKLIRMLNFTMPVIKDIGVEQEDVANGLLPDHLKKWYVNEMYYPQKKVTSSVLSQGTARTTATIIALFFSDYSIQFFEEPERNIHPSLINALIELFYDAGREKQIFLTTHSPEVVRFAKQKDIIVVKRNQDGFSEVFYPAEKEEVQVFLNADLNIASLYVDNLLESLR